MKRRSILLLLLAASGAGAAAPAPGGSADPPIAPFHAEYAVSRNGSELGRSTLVLRAQGDGTWILESATHGTEGLASLIGVDVVETSHFRWRDGRPESLDYRYRQHTAFKHRKRDIAFDRRSQRATVSDNGEVHRYPIEAGVIDRHCASLAIAADLARGATSLVYAVAVKDRVEPNHYRNRGHESVTVPAGRYDSVRIDRDDPGHQATSWFAPSLGWLPVRIEQSDKKGDTITLRLVSSG